MTADAAPPGRPPTGRGGYPGGESGAEDDGWGQPVPPWHDPGPPSGPGAVALLGLGTITALCMAFGIWLGWLVDRWLHSAPLFTIVGVFAGLVLGGTVSWLRIRIYLHD